MKKFIVLTILLGVLAFAQGGSMLRMLEKKSPQEVATQQTNRQAKNLKLTDAQKKKVGEINLKYAKLVKEIATKKADKKVKATEASALMDKRLAEYKSVLDAKQYEQIAKMQSKMKEKAGKKKEAKKADKK